MSTGNKFWRKKRERDWEVWLIKPQSTSRFLYFFFHSLISRSFYDNYRKYPKKSLISFEHLFSFWREKRFSTRVSLNELDYLEKKWRETKKKKFPTVYTFAFIVVLFLFLFFFCSCCIVCCFFFFWWKFEKTGTVRKRNMKDDLTSVWILFFVFFFYISFCCFVIVEMFLRFSSVGNVREDFLFFSSLLFQLMLLLFF